MIVTPEPSRQRVHRLLQNQEQKSVGDDILTACIYKYSLDTPFETAYTKIKEHKWPPSVEKLALQKLENLARQAKRFLSNINKNSYDDMEGKTFTLQTPLDYFNAIQTYQTILQEIANVSNPLSPPPIPRLNKHQRNSLKLMCKTLV